MELLEILQEYKEATISLIREIRSDGEFEYYINKREALLAELKNKTFSKKEIVNIYNELDIQKLDKVANNELLRLRDKIKVEMLELKKQRDATRGYNAQYKNVNFLNKQI